jgi:hypothetical protein
VACKHGGSQLICISHNHSFYEDGEPHPMLAAMRGAEAAREQVALGSFAETYSLLPEAPAKGRHDEFFILVDAETNEPLQDFIYGIETDFGAHCDTCYKDGATAKAYSQAPASVKLLFAMQMKAGIR